LRRGVSNRVDVSDWENVPIEKDVMTEILRAGAQKMLADMIHQEVEDWIVQRAYLRDEEGRRQVVRNGEPNFASWRPGSGHLVVFDPGVEVGFFDASRLAVVVGVAGNDCGSVVVKTLTFGGRLVGATMRACSFARVIAGRTASGTPTGR